VLSLRLDMLALRDRYISKYRSSRRVSEPAAGMKRRTGNHRRAPASIVFRESEYYKTIGKPSSFVNHTPQSYFQRLNRARPRYRSLIVNGKSRLRRERTLERSQRRSARFAAKNFDWRGRDWGSRAPTTCFPTEN
jgi:hypothetical protein